jgi:hypothetical protein
MSGMNQLLWYYADLEHDKCMKLLEMKQLEALNASDSNPFGMGVFKNEREPEGCILWRRFSK